MNEAGRRGLILAASVLWAGLAAAAIAEEAAGDGPEIAAAPPMAAASPPPPRPPGIGDASAGAERISPAPAVRTSAAADATGVATSAVPPARPAAHPAARSVVHPDRGPVTNLPLPRYVSLKASEGNVRRGPSLQHRIDWVYRRRAMPLQITAEFGHWRRVRDRDGAGGWVHYSLLSGVRTVLVEQDMVALRHRPEPGARVLARAEAGVVARLGRCLPAWCRITAGGQGGWVPKAALWGVGPGELRD
jgi:SH3-like domain-containing protein